MLYVKPDYYDKFSCIADKCEATCCAGWQIVIDEETLEKYHKYEGAFGNRLANSIDWREGVFKQYEDKRCAFLDENNLYDSAWETPPFANEGKTYLIFFPESLSDFETYMGHEIANQIKLAKEKKEKIAFILPVGPMGMYKWVVYFLKEWKVSCEHVYTFNMDEWADSEGNTLAPDNSGAFQYAMEQALFNPLGELTVPKNQRNFAYFAFHRRS